MSNQIEKKHIRVNGVSITCYCAGGGNDTIVLLHGAGVDSAMLSWAEVIPLLSSRYQVIAPDLPGYGASDRIDGEYTLSFYTDIVKGLIEAFGGKPVILTGLSLGGGICLNMALTYPELIKILVPVDAWGLFDKLSWHRLTHWFIGSKLNDNLYAWTNKYPSIIRFSLKYSLFGDKSKVSDDLVTEILKAMLEPGADKPFMSFQRSEITPTGFTTDLFGRLEEIGSPTLLIHGTLDKAVPVKGAILSSKRIPDCEMHLMEGCKHWPQKERPEEFANALQSYLDRKL
ncbi:pimeloyl-ACP methyl ester carboxylesterase [Kineothrix alysoides]|uniref:Pimeloyl-ACP methyl ester carboxylesterase n=1 Tax=Kineothrix alysoides TaxID=1469948 RepID=A0A4R1QME4_9FIRM|nr:alpha/beta hydrolase [Kineothrix alysoides]TCL54093.1 pimeloyl-ACP methyl ester carboxylesterase [Kineothrix alysoides]